VFEIADAQTAAWDPLYDYAFSRMGTQFFAAPVPAMRAIRGALKPGGRLAKVCWRRKADSPLWAETEQVVERFLSRPDEYEADTCGPGPFSLGNPETTRGILQAAGFDEIELHQRDFDYFMGADMDEAIDALLAIGPGAELIRLNGEYGESRRGEIAEALRDRYAAWQKPDGSIIGRGSVWIVAATNPGQLPRRRANPRRVTMGDDPGGEHEAPASRDRDRTPDLSRQEPDRLPLVLSGPPKPRSRR
jgi:hypothetical protein